MFLKPFPSFAPSYFLIFPLDFWIMAVGSNNILVETYFIPFTWKGIGQSTGAMWKLSPTRAFTEHCQHNGNEILFRSSINHRSRGHDLWKWFLVIPHDRELLSRTDCPKVLTVCSHIPYQSTYNNEVFKEPFWVWKWLFQCVECVWV